jgi:recombination associated protein RdgC
MFRNLRLYRIQGDWPTTEEALSERLDEAAFKPCGSFNEHSFGFEAPIDNAGGSLCRRVGKADLLQLRLQSRVLPPAVIREALAERIETFRQRAQRDPTRTEKREFKEEVYSDLLPRALLKSDRIQGFYLPAESILGVGTTSASNAERFLDTLRAAFGSLQATPLAFKQPMATLMKRVFLGDGPPEFVLGRECRMRDPSDAAASVNWLDMELADRSVRDHVRGGLQIDRLGVQFDARLSCVIDEDAILRKVRVLGLEASDDASDLDDEDPIARLDAEFVVTVGSIAQLLLALKKRLGGFG